MQLVLAHRTGLLAPLTIGSVCGRTSVLGVNCNSCEAIWFGLMKSVRVMTTYCLKNRPATMATEPGQHFLAERRLSAFKKNSPLEPSLRQLFL